MYLIFFRNCNEKKLDHIFYGQDLLHITAIQAPNNKLIPNLQIDIACDVQNTFTGPLGAVNVFSKQKGATPEQQQALEQGMQKVASLIHAKYPSIDLNATSGEHAVLGAGAAGGIAGTFFALQQASLKKGIQLMAEYLSLEEHIKASALVFTVCGTF